MSSYNKDGISNRMAKKKKKKRGASKKKTSQAPPAKTVSPSGKLEQEESHRTPENEEPLKRKPLKLFLFLMPLVVLAAAVICIVFPSETGELVRDIIRDSQLNVLLIT